MVWDRGWLLATLLIYLLWSLVAGGEEPAAADPVLGWIRWMEVVSQASPNPFRSADRFQYRHAEEGSGDLGPLYLNS